MLYCNIIKKKGFPTMSKVRAALFLSIMSLLFLAFFAPLCAFAAPVPRTAIALSERSYYTRETDLIYGVEIESTVEDICAVILSDTEDLRFTSIKGAALPSSGLVGTGTVVTLTLDGQERDSCTFVVKGDVDGNGKISSSDYLLIKRGFKDQNAL